MTAHGRPEITPELMDRFNAYYRANPTWGSLHIVLEDWNLATHHVEWCLGYAQAKGDAEGAELAQILLGMSKSQRGRISKRADDGYRGTS